MKVNDLLQAYAAVSFSHMPVTASYIDLYAVPFVRHESLYFLCIVRVVNVYSPF